MSNPKGPLFLPSSSDGLKPPYPPFAAALGGSPTKSFDVPITSVFLVLFIIGAITHMTILQVNLRRGKRFLMTGLLFGFCMARNVTMTMRLVWCTYETNLHLAIAAQVFVAAGVILPFIVNLIFAQRIVRACHPNWAWAQWFSLAFKVFYASIVAILIALIFCTVQSLYTLDHNIRKIDRDVQLVGSTYFAVAAFLPIPLVVLSVILPKQSRIEKFGQGRFRSKIYILLFSSTILSLGAAFRAGIAYVPRTRGDPAWYHSKACFYIINFTIEIIVVALYAITRVDKRFHVPNGSHAAGDYSGANKEGLEEKPIIVEKVLSSGEKGVDNKGKSDRYPVKESEEMISDLEAGSSL